MKIFRSVNEVRDALNKYLQANGDSRDGAHYVRPDGSRGPVVRYLPYHLQLLVAVDRAEGGGWKVSNAWLRKDKLPANQLFWFQNAEVGA